LTFEKERKEKAAGEGKGREGEHKLGTDLNIGPIRPAHPTREGREKKKRGDQRKRRKTKRVREGTRRFRKFPRPPMGGEEIRREKRGGTIWGGGPCTN